MLNIASHMLTEKLAKYLERTIENGYPSGGIAETLGLDTSFLEDRSENTQNRQVTIAERTKLEFLAACNNAEKISNNIESFCGQLKEQLLSNFSHITDSRRLEGLNHCLNELQGTAKAFQSLQDIALQELNTQSLKQQIKPQVANFNTVSRVLTETEHAEYQANDPWVQQLIYAMDDLLTNFRYVLSESIYSKLVGMLTSLITTHLERLILKSSFNQLGAFQLENELRTIISYLNATSSRSVRHQFARLLQISRLLNLERPSELLDYWGANAGSMTWRLTPGEIRNVLGLRQDFANDEIRRLQL